MATFTKISIFFFFLLLFLFVQVKHLTEIKNLISKRDLASWRHKSKYM